MSRGRVPIFRRLIPSLGTAVAAHDGTIIVSVRVPGGSMRVVLQRVSRASVTIEGRVASVIGRGFCVLVGFTHGDGEPQVDWMADKVASLRLFADRDGKMNVGLADA